MKRYVAIGDSTTEGLDDPDGAGGFRGWANRLAERLAAAQGSILYANLAVRGRSTRQIREEQLAAAAALRPDLSTVVAGMNDLVAPRFDADGVARDVEAMQRTLIAQGAPPSSPSRYPSSRACGRSHARASIAAGLAHALGLPGADDSWTRPTFQAPLRTARLAWPPRRHGGAVTSCRG